LDAEVETMPARAESRARDRIAAAFLLCLMTVGSFVLWIGVPAASLYAASKVVDSLAGHFVVALPLTLAAMIAWGSGLFWLNGLYLRVTGFFDEPEDPDEPPRRIRGPLEPILIGSMIVAVLALFIWFFAFAENPSSQVI
jgi:hypothetical protein